MSNQSLPRPLFRLGSIARPVQPQPSPPAAPGSAPRPTMLRPTFRPPIFTQPQSSQDPASPLQPPRSRAPPPPVTPASVASPLLSPPKSLPVIATTRPLTRESPPTSPVTRRSPLASPLSQKSPLASSVAQNNPPASPDTQQSPSSPPKPRTQVPPPSIQYSEAMKQEVSQSVPLPPPKSVSPIPSPMSSPRAAKPLPETPPGSPSIKSALHSPPSPPLHPLPQLKSDVEFERKIPAIAEQKTMLHVGKTRSVLNPYGDYSDKYKEQESKRVSDSDNIGLRVISISGENKGAIMELGYSPKTQGNPHKLTSEGELSEGNANRNHNNAKAKAKRSMHAYMNSNVQGVNSSIVFNSTLSHHDPGVHFSLTRSPGKDHLKGHSNGDNVIQKESGYRFSD